jgi:arylsulfatase A-like enzyme
VALTRRNAIGAALGAGIALASKDGFARVPGAVPKRPNIVFIMADDLGYGDLGSFGKVYETPHIDSLAQDGIKFTQAYANSCVCTATRAGLVTGRYQNRFPVGLQEPLPFDSSVGLDPATPTMPRYLQALGYRTVLVGKWHLGDPPEYGPLKSGYDRFFGVPGGGKDYFLSPKPTESNTLHDGDRMVLEHRYLTDEFGDRAIAEIAAARHDGVPLFLSLHFTAPHWPWEGPEDMLHAEQIDGNIVDNEGGSIATFQKMLTSLDANVGNVLAALERLGMARDTLVIFTSDNGGERFSNVWPLTGMKCELLEGGIRVPVVARWPGHISRGSVSEQVAISMDWMPTFLEMAGAPAGFDAPTDGISILPMLKGGAPVPRELFWQYKANDQAAVRDGRWKYLRLGGREYLFDLAVDEHERANRAKAEPAVFERLRARHAAWAKTMLPYPKDSASYSNVGNVPDRYEEPAVKP